VKRTWLIVVALLAAAAVSTSSFAAGSHVGEVLIPSLDESGLGCQGFYFVTLSGDVVSCLAIPGGRDAVGAHYGVAADGTAVFAGQLLGPAPVTLVRTDGSVVAVDSSPRDFDPAISPDGSKVAFARFVSTDPSKGSNLYTVNPDGSDLTLIAAGNGQLLQRPTFSPNGAALVYSCSIADWKAPQALCGPLPDGTDRQNGLMLMKTDGSGKRMIVLNGASDEPVSWSPDGQTIAAVGSAPCPNCSPAAGGFNSQVFLYSTSGRDLFNANAPSLQVTHETDDVGALFPQFTADGSQILFMKTIDDNGISESDYSYLITRIGGDRHEIFFGVPDAGCAGNCPVPLSWGVLVPPITTGGPSTAVNAMRIVAPKLRGLTLAAATKLLTARGLRLGTVTKQYSSTVPKYRVLSQYPRAGTVVKRGSQKRPPVNVVLSRGPQT
jgi:hypothetical protein